MIPGRYRFFKVTIAPFLAGSEVALGSVPSRTGQLGARLACLRFQGLAWLAPSTLI